MSDEEAAVRYARERVRDADWCRREVHDNGKPDHADVQAFRWFVEQYDAQEKARAEMPEVVRDAAELRSRPIARQHPAGVYFAEALLAAHDREVALRAEVSNLRDVQLPITRNSREANRAARLKAEAEVAELRKALREACERGYRLAGLECSSSDEDRFDELLKLAAGPGEVKP